MDDVGVVAVNQRGMGDEFRVPGGDLLCADADDGTCHDLASDRIAVAEQDFVAFT